MLIALGCILGFALLVFLERIANAPVRDAYRVFSQSENDPPSGIVPGGKPPRGSA